MVDIAVNKVTNPGVLPNREKLGFGTYFSDHMFVMDYKTTKGWYDPRIVPYDQFLLYPSAMVYHYGQAIFEGMKAFRNLHNEVVIFRTMDHLNRFNHSADILCIPQMDTTVLHQGLTQLIELDKRWVPEKLGTSLYIRPFVIATDPYVGVKVSDTYMLFIILSPSGAYYAAGFNPVNIMVEDHYVRAVPGGTGEAKTGGNYASSLVAQAQAAQKGCDQVVWLDAVEHRWIEEMGTNNMYFVYGSGPSARIMTPALTGTLLPGVVRDSLLTVAKDLGYSVDEGRISTDEWQAECASGGITEVFGCGTAAVITPIGEVRSAAADWTIADGRPGPITMQLRNALLDVQTGHAPDAHGWMHTLV